MTAPRTRLPALSFPDETDSHSVAQPPKRGVGLPAQEKSASVKEKRAGAPAACPSGHAERVILLCNDTLPTEE